VDQDGDGSEDTNITFGENTSAGGDETGRGILTGADLVWTQHGNISGATGSPPYRTTDGNDDYWSTTQNWWDAIFKAQSTYTFVIKVSQSGDQSYFIEFRGTDLLFSAKYDSHEFRLQDSDNAREDLATANAWPTSTITWIAIWCDASVTRAGVTTSGSGANGQPTKWSDFASGDRVEFTNLYDNFPTADSRTFVGGIPGSTDWFTAFDFYYAVVSKTCLIDNAS
jgi:hypothetical protein